MMVEVRPIEKGIYIFNGRKASPLFCQILLPKKTFLGQNCIVIWKQTTIFAPQKTIQNNRIMATKLYTLEEMKDKHIGLVGTPKRDEYERTVKEDVEAYDYPKKYTLC